MEQHRVRGMITFGVQNLIVDFSNIVGFDWADANFYKNIGKHSVFDTEAEQIFFNHPLVVRVYEGNKEIYFYSVTSRLD
jgi:hypothetical protein